MYKAYKITYEDTIEEVAKKSNTTIEELIDLNGDFDIIPGNYIVVPNRQSQMFDLYKVQSGDNMYALSKKYNVNIDDLLALNGLNKNDYIYPNQELLVPTGLFKIYITKNGDTFSEVVEKLGITIDDITDQNEKIYLLPDQLIVYKRKENL